MKYFVTLQVLNTQLHLVCHKCNEISKRFIHRDAYVYSKQFRESVYTICVMNFHKWSAYEAYKYFRETPWSSRQRGSNKSRLMHRHAMREHFSSVRGNSPREPREECVLVSLREVPWRCDSFNGPSTMLSTFNIPGMYVSQDSCKLRVAATYLSRKPPL